MKTELILGTLDPAFDTMLDEALANSAASLPIRHLVVKGSWASLFNQLYLFSASRELLDDIQGRFTKIQHRHLIPYTVVTHKGKIALYARTPKGTESQLHGKHSIGFGGHIDLVDVAYFGETGTYGGVEYKRNSIDLASTVGTALGRELEEELGVHPDNIESFHNPMSAEGYDTYMNHHYGEREHSLIISRASDVDSRHLALVYRVELKDISELVIEDRLNFIGWFTVEELRSQYFEELESWSQAIIAGNDPLKTPTFY